MKEKEKKKENEKASFLLVVIVFNEFDDNVFLGLNLEHFHDEAHERSGFSIATVSATDMVELHGLVNQRLRRQPETLLLPVGVLVYLGANYLLHQVLWVRSPYALGSRVCTVRHCRFGLSRSFA